MVASEGWEGWVWDWLCEAVEELVSLCSGIKGAAYTSNKKKDILWSEAHFR